jgi:peptide/nickel transport system substrate-binding protein
VQNFLNKLGLLILLGLAVLTGGFLFFEDRMSTLADLIGWNKTVENIDNSGQVLKIAYLFKPADLNPFSGDPAVQTRLLDVYENLVQVDRDLNLKPGLAVAYGLKNGNQWDFELRQGVKFQNGQEMQADDVIYSYQKAREINDPSFADLFADIERMEKLNDYSVRFVASQTDPLFLNKLSKLPIIPRDFTDFSHPVGTGPYKVDDATDLNNIYYLRNENYWGKKPYYQKVKVEAMPVKNERLDALLNGEIDLLVNVPPDAVNQIKSAGLQVELMPSLEVGFAIFNFNDDLLKNRALRQAIAQALNKTSFLDLAKGYAKTVNQFVSNGVFGYNPDIKGIEYDQDAAKTEITKEISGFENLKLKFSFPQNLKLLGQYFKEQLQLVGIDLELNPLSDQDLQTQLQSGNLQFYYLGWRSDLGDALPFLKSVVDARGENAQDGLYNGANYNNDKVTQLIRDSETDFNLQERLKKMQEVMKIIVEDDILGVPLFETESIFAMSARLEFKPRFDSLVYPSSISLKETNKPT